MRGIRPSTTALWLAFEIVLCSGLWLAWASAGLAAAEPRIRVLLLEGQTAVVVSDARTAQPIARVSAAATKRLRVDGGPLVPRWRLTGHPGPVEVEGIPVRGEVEVIAISRPDGSTGLAVINEVPLELYLAGTLAREMYASWGAEALRAQAVASRTYALQQRQAHHDELWHVSASTRSQVYAGIDAESPAVWAALAATRGEVLAYRGEPILAVFHSSSGGRTASAEEVWGQSRDYLVSVEVVDEWDSPDSYWRAPVSRTTLGRALASVAKDIGEIVRARVTERSESGRATRIELVGENGTLSLGGRSLRSALGESVLKSTLFELREEGEGFVFVGAGSGHGVGMSQWGARAMARRGDDYREILSSFYPGATLTKTLRERGGTQ